MSAVGTPDTRKCFRPDQTRFDPIGSDLTRSLVARVRDPLLDPSSQSYPAARTTGRIHDRGPRAPRFHLTTRRG